MIAARWQGIAALGVAGVALVAGLIASRGPEDDMLARYGREQTERKARKDAVLNLHPVDEDPPPPAEDDDVPEAVIVEVHEDAVMISGQTMTDDEVEAAFRAAFGRDPEARVVFQADPGVGHGRIVDLMERAKSAGLTRLAIGTTDSP